LSWIIAIVETIAIHSFNRLVFNIGIPIVKRRIEISTKNFSPNTNQTIKGSEGKFRFYKDSIVLFCSQIFISKFSRINTPFPFKITGVINNDNTINITARLPFGTILFFIFWLAIWNFGTIRTFIESGDMNSIGFSIIGWIFAAFIFITSYNIEKKRLENMILELKEIITP